MSFFLGIVLGIAFGFGLVIAFARSETSRSKRRRELAASVASFSKMSFQDSRKIFPAAFYPSWVIFSHRQKLKWLNHELIKIWPYVNEAASEIIRTSIEPVLEQYKSAILSSFKFSKLNLGTVAPQFTDISFTGVFRVIFKPLTEHFPCFGAVSYSLRDKKKLDFTLKVIGGEISTIPGISDAIEETIHDAIEDSISWPVRKVVPILPGDYSDLELRPVGILEVKLVQARNLTNKDIIGKSDPFAVLYIRPIRARMKISKVISNDLNPIWNEHFEFVVEDVPTQNLVVKIYDDDGVRPPELIGCARVRLKDLQPGKVEDIWLKLVKDLEVQRDKKDRGQVHLELLYCPYDMEDEIVNPFAHQLSMTSLEKALKSGKSRTKASHIHRTPTNRKRDVILRGVLSVTVISANNLPAMDMSGKSDPYVVLSMKKMSTINNRTRVVNESLNPIWDQTFDFVVEDGLHDILILEVWDHDTFGKDYIGRCILTLTKVIVEKEYSDSFPLEGAKSGRLNLHFKWTPLPIYRA